jgi:hypothetical protein
MNFLELLYAGQSLFIVLKEQISNELKLFHHEWSHRDEVLESIHCFTLIEITCSILALQ